MDGGEFKVLVFNQETHIADIFVNDIIGIDNSTVPINGISDPLISVCFTDKDTLFINLFYRQKSDYYYFLYNFRKGKLLSEVFSICMHT